MSNRITISCPFSVEREGDEIELEVTGRYYPGEGRGNQTGPGDSPELSDIEAVDVATDLTFELTADELERAEVALLAQAKLS